MISWSNTVLESPLRRVAGWQVAPGRGRATPAPAAVGVELCLQSGHPCRAVDLERGPRGVADADAGHGGPVVARDRGGILGHEDGSLGVRVKSRRKCSRR